MSIQRSLKLLVLSVLGLAFAAAAAPDLEVWIGSRRHQLEAEVRGNETYYPLRKIAEIIGLELEERGGLLTVEGPRGKLRLVADRPLVRLGDEYVLLSAPVWRKSSKDWYVTADFLMKALPLIVDRRLEQMAGGRYELQPMAEIPVRVRIANYPDHVRVVFESDERIPVQVVEYGEFIEVRFGNHAIQAELPARSPDPRFVSSVVLNREGAYRAFRIHKGDRYQSFREFSLDDPLRKVVDVYGRVAADALPGRLEPPQPPPMAPSGSAMTSEPDESPLAPILRRREMGKVITIDPGHGGEEPGVTSPGGLTEKDLNLQIATLVGRLLQSRDYEGMLTRSRDVELGAEQRSAVGNYNRSKVFLSMHAGGSASPEPRGAVVYVHKYLEPPPGGEQSGSGDEGLVAWHEGQRRYLSLSRELAQRIQTQMNLLWGVNNQVLELPLGILAPVTAPAVLIEIGFLTNPRDEERLQIQDFQEQIAGRIVSAVVGFLEDHPEMQMSASGGNGSD